jgi:predicted O-methyltransferase YrrM
VIILSQTEREFIRKHLTDDVRELLLRAKPVGVDSKKMVAQILARQKAREKLPQWYANDALLFPPALSVEQASSEQTARYKASLVSGKRLLDLTGGMGVDSWAFAERIGHVTYIERNDELAQLAAYNLPQLGATNLSVRCGDGMALLESLDATGDPIDWIYLDPHRRDATGGKVVRLEDCEPDISQPGILNALRKRAKQILLKTSPLLDIDLAIKQVHDTVESVHIVAVQGEVKEVLLILGNQTVTKEAIQLNSVNLLNNQTIYFSFTWHEERSADVILSDPEQYLYEPNAAVLKSGAFRLAGTRYGLKKLAPNSHLYTNGEIKSEFPGRIFSILDVIKPDAKTLKTRLPELKANLTVRNFPQSVAELRKKLSLREGGAIFIFATTLLNGEKRLIITEKVDVHR